MVQGWTGAILFNIAGYAAAALAAVVVTIFFMVLPTAIDAFGDPATLASLLDTLPKLFYPGLSVTLITGLPGFLLVLWIARRRGWVRWTRYGVAGFANVFVAMALLSLYAGGPIVYPQLLLPCFPGGYAGGIVYWLIAVKWRSRLPA